jgi:3-dehydroquinate dehydratase-2
MKILVINGVNLNMLGKRETNLYGEVDYKSLVKRIKKYGKEKGAKIKTFQSNCEGAICTKIQKARNKFDAIIINAGAYTHTSIAILDALKSSNVKAVEVHITNVLEREEFRHFSYVGLYAEKSIIGKGLDGYNLAIDYIMESK